MSIIKQDYGELSGGEHYEETLLWTNPSPTASEGYTDTTVTLNDDVSNYDYLKFVYNSSLATNVIMSVIVSVKDWYKCKGEMSSTTSPCSIRLGYTSSSSGTAIGYARGVFYVSNTSVRLANTVRLNAAGTANTACIPLGIYGLKKVGGSGGNVSITDISVVGKTLLGTITTAGGTYTATEDCLMAGKVTGSSSAYAYVMFDGNAVFNSTSSVGLIGYSASNVNSPDTYGLFVPKGTIVSTRSSGTYSLYFYSLK